MQPSDHNVNKKNKTRFLQVSKKEKRKVQGMPQIEQTYEKRRPRWLSWMRRPTGEQEVAGSAPAEVGNILPWRLITKNFLGHSLPSAN